MNDILFIVKENLKLKEKIKLYEISTKSDFEKINNLNEKILFLENIINNSKQNKKYIE